MAPDVANFREEMKSDYQGALLRLATLRADGKHHLLFAWVELFPFDMSLPSDWTAGEKPWSVPGGQGWTLGFTARRLSISDALEWYESAGNGQIDIGFGSGQSRKVTLVPLGPEPIYGQFCCAVSVPFALAWHQGPRIHRFVPLKEPFLAVQRLAAIASAREWLQIHLGFDPYQFDEWLGGIALVAPDPICSSFSVFPSARTADGTETLTIYAVPRRSEAKGVADLSSLSTYLAERRIDGWAMVNHIDLDESGYTTINKPQSFSEIGCALVCAKRGLLRFEEPLSWVEQINIGMNVGSGTVKIEVPPGGRKKPGTVVDVHRHFKGPDTIIGEPLNEVVRKRLAKLRQRRKIREERNKAPQKILGVTGNKANTSQVEINSRRKEAENFVANLVVRARRQVIFVDPFFGDREMRLFALRASTNAVVPRILTSRQALDIEDGKAGDRFAADWEALSRETAIQVPKVRVMPGNDKPVIHDRYLIVDNEVWHCGPSFNELGERLGIIVRLPDPLSVRRLISKIWCRSTPLISFWQSSRKSVSNN